ncbi:MAG TPA: HD domain-containing protein [Acidimicrobiia bacterium]|nr:HD domain-containing protein [Acidimicrobiia bacterium]
MSEGLKPFSDLGFPLQARSDEIDRLLGGLAQAHPELGVLAVGGYGRAELSLHSDIDLLFLHEGPPPEEAIRSILYPLWDSRHKVGHATRTVRASLTFARDDLAALCSLLSARLISGPPPLFDELQAGLAKLLAGARAHLPELLAAEEHRVWEREPFARQELDIKSGRGGLRSHHRLEWDRKRSRLIGEQPRLPAREDEEAAVATLLQVREALHAVQRRAADLYYVELRSQVGDWLGRDPTELATEVYGAARTIDGAAALRWGRVRPAGTDPINHAGLAVIRLVRSRWGKREPAATPFAYARAAAASGSGGRLSVWERDFVARLGPPDWHSGDRSSLLALLAEGSAGWEALLGLWEAGWLAGALPELGHVRGLAQVAPFHQHPVDAHLGATVANVVELADGAIDWCGEIADQMGGLDEVLLAAFLHDIGKGLPGDHSVTGSDLARKLLIRIGFPLTTAGVVGEAVRHHLLLPETAFRRDIEDPAVIGLFAASVGSLDFLRLLTLLSVADARSTGADMWSPWKESLLRALFTRAAAVFEGRETSLPEAVVDELAILVPELDPRSITDHLEGMPPDYLGRFGTDVVATHLRLAHPDLGAAEVRTAVVPGAPVSNIVVAARDRQGLLATVAGVLALHNLNVLEARVVTRNDGLAIDTFRVADSRGSDMVGQGRWPAVRETLERTVAGTLDLEARLAEKHTAPLGANARATDVRVSGTTIDIRTRDRVGLLHDLALAMTSLGLSITLAKIDTRRGEAIDVFGVTKPTHVTDEAIERALTAVGGVAP